MWMKLRVFWHPPTQLTITKYSAITFIHFLSIPQKFLLFFNFLISSLPVQSKYTYYYFLSDHTHKNPSATISANNGKPEKPQAQIYISRDGENSRRRNENPFYFPARVFWFFFIFFIFFFGCMWHDLKLKKELYGKEISTRQNSLYFLFFLFARSR